jgi:prepilin-type N-terminal cleavage/methylation domain-containing protein
MKLPSHRPKATRLRQNLSGLAPQSGEGPTHSKTRCAGRVVSIRASVLECASPLALLPRLSTRVQTINELRSNAAFTLIEVMISSALMALILVSAYLCLGAGFSAQKMIEPRAEIIQNARVAMALLSADLRAACPLSKTDDFLGMTRTVGDMEADNLDFGTHNYTPRRAREGDFCQESIYLDKKPETGQFSLWRRRNPTIGLDALTGGTKEEIAQGVVGLKVEYFDGTDWFDTWGDVDAKKQNSAKQKTNLAGLPEAVRITLLMDSNPKKKNPNTATGEEKMEPPFVFQTIVRLNLADATQATENSSSTTSPDGSSSPGQQTPNNGGNN